VPFPIGGPLSLSLTVSEIFNVESSNVTEWLLVDMTLIRPLNKGQEHSDSH